MKNRVEKYRHIFFNSDMGKEVLEDILTMCRFGTTLDPDNPAMVAEHNVGTVILTNCGVFAPKTGAQVINALTAVMPEQNTEDD